MLTVVSNAPNQLKFCKGAACSQLGFGCGAVMGRVGRKASLRAMHAAFDAGVTLFDTARSYGYGEAEAVLGEFAAGRRDQLLISTKYGIEPARRRPWKAILRPAARVVLNMVPQARRAIRRQAADQIQAAPLNAHALRASLEISLRQLGADYVDFLFLHDVPAESVEQDDLFDAMERLRDQGKLRCFGVSSSLEAAQAAMQRPDALALQIPMNQSNLGPAKQVSDRARKRACPLFANHIFGGVVGAHAAAMRLQSLATATTLPAELREKMLACGEAILPRVMLPLVLRYLKADAAIVSMMGEANISANVAALESDFWTDAELEVLFLCLTS